VTAAPRRPIEPEVVARQRDGSYIRKALSSCQRCLAWGMPYAQGICSSCYNFSAPQYGLAEGACGACQRVQPLRDGYCRSCWVQAAEDRLTGGGNRRSRVTIAPHLPLVRFHQLFFTLPAQRTAKPRTTPRRWGEKGRPLKAEPLAVGRPDTRSVQLPLFPDNGMRQYRYGDIDLRTGPELDNPWLAWAFHIAHTHAEARGWKTTPRFNMQRALVTLLFGYRYPDIVRATDFQSVIAPLYIGIDLVLEILEAMGIGDDDRPQTFDMRLHRKTDHLPPVIRDDARAWAMAVNYGGPRSRPKPGAAGNYLKAVLPMLDAWALRYHHLREVTHDDVTAQVALADGGPPRELAITAVRSLFSWAKRHKLIFRNPANGLKIRKAEPPIRQPLPPEAFTQSVLAATTPQARLWVALAAVHAARPGHIRKIGLDDVDLSNRRITIAGVERPLDDLTHRLLLQYLKHRRAHWPNTANAHLFVSRESALRYGPVSQTWVINLRGMPGTIEGLRIDRLLEEALASQGDPLHLLELFGISDGTAIRWANNALKLLESASEAQAVVRHEPQA